MCSFPSSSTRNLRLVILGLDGGEWNILRPLLSQGVLENFSKLYQAGVHSGLTSVIPPVTGPAWPAMATGLNPGKLGTFDFLNRKSIANPVLYPVRTHLFQGKTFWDRLSDGGLKFGIFNFPMLVPAYAVSGWMVAGLGASKLQQWVWPQNLASQLERAADPYLQSVSYGLPKYRDRLDVLLDDLIKMVEGQFRALVYVLDHDPVDVLFAVIGASDVLAHTMWHVWDWSHPLFDENQSAQLTPKVNRLWKIIDDGIGRLQNRLDSDGNLMCVSDHGFGPSFGVFNTNTWLQKNQFLHRRGGVSEANNRFRAKLTKSLTPYFGSFMRSILGSKAHHALRESILLEIDLTRTKAFALETTDVCGMIFVNHEYANINSLEETAFVEETTKEIIQRLHAYAGESGLRIEVYRSRDLYQGEFVELAPEIVFRVNDSAVSASHLLSSEIYENRPHHPMKTGNHRQEGVFVGWGSKFKQGVALEEPLSILDIAPTVFHLLGEPVPDDLDGKVAINAFRESDQEIVYTSQMARSPGIDQDELSMSISDEDDFQQRLRDLGYLE